jgi:hypothetical protein
VAEDDQVKRSRGGRDLQPCCKLTEQAMAVIMRRVPGSKYQPEIDITLGALVAPDKRAEEIGGSDLRVLAQDRCELLDQRRQM